MSKKDKAGIDRKLDIVDKKLGILDKALDILDRFANGSTDRKTSLQKISKGVKKKI